jgi:xylitol oxidase
MNKRTFLKLSSALLATPLISPLFAWMKEDKIASDKLKNWAGNLEYSTKSLYSANSLEQTRDFVKKKAHLKVLGTRHCFNNIADSKYNLLSLRPMDKVIALDPAARTVTVEAGISYGQLAPYLESKGFALHNLASLPHISVAGACSTGTHGSGVKNGNLSTAASGLEMVTAAGEVVTLSREKDGETFRGAVIGIGALGAVT